MSEGRMEILAFHGWGLAANVWAPWKSRLPTTATLQCSDRGYFGAPAEAHWMERIQGESDPPRRILLLHSMAPLFLPREILAGAEVVLLFGSFRTFHPSGGIEDERSREILSRMREALDLDPWQVLASFRKRCGFIGRGDAIAGRDRGSPGRESARTSGAGAMADSALPLNTALLAADLDRLDSEEVDFRALSEDAKVLVLHGTADRIVPAQKGEELADSIGRSAVFIPVDGAGHALPFSHPDEVIWRITQELEAAQAQ